MGKYIITRILQSFLVLMLVATITFLLMNMVPGSPFLSEKPPSPEVMEQLNKKYGLDKPLSVQLKKYLINTLKLDFGVSLKMQKNR